MRHWGWVIRLAPCAAVLATVAAWSAPLPMPASLSDYRSWKALVASPQPIPFQLAQLCAPALPGGPPPPTAVDRDKHGPHARRWVRVYANPAAASALADPAVRKFPPGATIAKEKLLTVDADHPEGVAFMIKHRAGQFAASGGWEFLYFPSGGTTADYSGCIGCHRAKGRKDYVFGTYGPDATR